MYLSLSLSRSLSLQKSGVQFGNTKVLNDIRKYVTSPIAAQQKLGIIGTISIIRILAAAKDCTQGKIVSLCRYIAGCLKVDHNTSQNNKTTTTANASHYWNWWQTTPSAFQ
jgi:hypothetical protein